MAGSANSSTKVNQAISVIETYFGGSRTLNRDQ
jgi:hypothetical protein